MRKHFKVSLAEHHEESLIQVAFASIVVLWRVESTSQGESTTTRPSQTHRSTSNCFCCALTSGLTVGYLYSAQYVCSNCYERVGEREALSRKGGQYHCVLLSVIVALQGSMGE